MTPNHQGQRGKTGSGSRRRNTPQPRAIPAPRSQPHPYRGAEGQLDPFWVDTEAERVAREIATLPSTQIRRFFSEVKGLKRQLELLTSQDKGDARLERQVAWAQIHPRFAMLKSQVVYAQGRIGAKNMPDAFVQFIIDHVAWVKGVEDFDAFLAHFEAVVGFHRYLTTAKG